MVLGRRRCLVQQERRTLRPAGFAPTEAKLRLPTRPDGLVPRTALIDRLVGAPSSGVVLITAPAGYGKTVLASQWAEEDPRPFAWLTADAGDNDPRMLATYLLIALHRLEPLDAELLAALADQPDERLVATIRPLVARMLPERRPFALVVDNADAL